MAVKCPKCQTNNPDTVKFCGECGTPLEADVFHTKTLETPKEELTRGTVFDGRYEIIEELGKGGKGKVFRALGNEVRLNLLGLLAVREMCIYEIVEAVEGANSTVVHHLRILTEGGLVDSYKDGKFTIFKLNHDLIKKHNVLEESGTCC